VEDIQHAYKARIFSRQLEGYENKYGFMDKKRRLAPK
jgi:hypothetical protein